MSIGSPFDYEQAEYEQVSFYQTENAMGRFASSKGGGDFQQPPIGTHMARCIKLIDLGTQKNEYQGKISFKNQVLVTWELPLELMDGENEGKPFLVSKFYTNSLNEKANMRHDLVTWRGKEFSPEEEGQFDLQNILGKPCMLSIIHNDSGKARVSAVLSLPKGQTCPPAINAQFCFWLDEFDAEKFDSISDGIKNIIKLSPEYAAVMAPPPPGTPSNGGAKPAFDDDIPF